MSDVTRLLEAIERGEPQAAEDLLPLVYEELRRLAHSSMAGEKPGQTLQATALVHEAWLRLTGGAESGRWSEVRQLRLRQPAELSIDLNGRNRTPSFGIAKGGFGV